MPDETTITPAEARALAQRPLVNWAREAAQDPDGLKASAGYGHASKRLTEIADLIESLAAQVEALRRDSARLDWLERKSTLHGNVEILYVVDGYEVDVMVDDGATCQRSTHGETVRAAIDAHLAEEAGR